MENMIGRTFDSLARRIAYGYAGTMPDFAPVSSNRVSDQSQRQMYELLVDVANALYLNPGMLGLTDAPDDWYDDWQLRNRRPELDKLMSVGKRKLDEFYLQLLDIGRRGEPLGGAMAVPKSAMKFSSKATERLNQIGLELESQKEQTLIRCPAHPDCFPAWKLLAETAQANNPHPEASPTAVTGAYLLLAFSHAIFDRTHPYSRDAFCRLSPAIKTLSRLEALFSVLQYEYLDVRESELSMDWYKNYGKQAEPLKSSWAERDHGGFSITFDYARKNQLLYGLRVPKYKELLTHFDEMDEPLKDFIVRQGKQCDGCGYCTQTDKTGKRPRQLISVEHNGRHAMCLMFPGFSYRWTSVTDETADDIIRFIRFCDRVLG